MKPVRFLGNSKETLSGFPKAARNRVGHELFMVQVGRDPDDWKPMSRVGPGAAEIRVRTPDGAFRVIYVARFASAVYVLHSFQKKTHQTALLDIRIAQRRYRDARDMERASQ
ncbi:MAG: type II toxin-antitoxin system RelE/ParE family toxin [Pseudomonadota bacterium]